MNLGEQYDPQTQATINRGQALYNTRTGQIIGEQANGQQLQQPDIAGFEKAVTGKKLSFDELQALAKQYGIPQEYIDRHQGAN